MSFNNYKPFKKRNLTAKYLLIFVLGISFSLFFSSALNIVTGIENAKQYIKQIVLTSDGTASGVTGIVLDGINGNIISNGFISKGFGVSASGLDSTSIGKYTQAFGDYTTAIGMQAQARGMSSTSIGYRTYSSGELSTAIGYYAESIGILSTAIGNHPIANGSYSIAMGTETIANGDYSTVIGKFNVGASNSIFEIGIGTGDSNRENAITVLNNGNLGIGTNNPSSKLTVDGSRILASDNGDTYLDLNQASGYYIIGDIATALGDSYLKINPINNKSYFRSTNLGIGTDNPLYTLDVNGNSRLSGNVGIGGIPTSYKLNVNGNLYISSNSYLSGTTTIDKILKLTETTLPTCDISNENVIINIGDGQICFCYFGTYDDGSSMSPNVWARGSLNHNSGIRCQ